MDNINKKLCKLDNECDNNELCAFNEDDLNHYCISNDKNNLYAGCLNQRDENFNYIESSSKVDYQNPKSCIDFTRRQVNGDGYSYNYMIYKKKKDTYLDTTTINIYLKCENEILAIIPYNDYFNLKCDDSQENCILESKEPLLNFIKQNSQNCTKKIYLEVIYECENEGLKKEQKIPVDLDNYNIIKIDLKCPIDNNNDKFKSKCIATYLDNNYMDKNRTSNILDLNKPLHECIDPVFKIPLIVNNPNNYKKLKDINSKNEMKSYDSKINEKIEDLKKLKAEKYIKLKKIQDGREMTLEEASDIISNYPSEKLVDNPQEYWQLFNNYDAAQYLFSDNEADNVNLKFYGSVYTIEDAKAAANENNQSFFVWYHNSYELDNFASKLYFIDMYNIDNTMLDKSNWAMHDNVTTGILKLENYTESSGGTDEDKEKIANLIKLIKTSSTNTSLMNAQYMELIKNNMTDYNVNLSVVDNLNNKITTYGQAINMNNYETGINNNILIVLGIALLAVVIIFVFVMVYFNNKTGGKIKLFSFEGKPPQ
jgi:hypothetical protein